MELILSYKKTQKSFLDCILILMLVYSFLYDHDEVAQFVVIM